MFVNLFVSNLSLEKIIDIESDLFVPLNKKLVKNLQVPVSSKSDSSSARPWTPQTRATTSPTLRDWAWGPRFPARDVDSRCSWAQLLRGLPKGVGLGLCGSVPGGRSCCRYLNNASYSAPPTRRHATCAESQSSMQRSGPFYSTFESRFNPAWTPSHVKELTYFVSDNALFFKLSFTYNQVELWKEKSYLILANHFSKDVST